MMAVTPAPPRTNNMDTTQRDREEEKIGDSLDS